MKKDNFENEKSVKNKNIQLLFNLVNLNYISFKFIADFKLLLLINGQQTASAMFPCPYCYISLNELLNRKNLKHKTDDIECLTSDNKCTNLKTYKNLKEDYEVYCSKGKKKRLAKDCHSTVNLSLLEEDDSTFVLEKCIIPELHLLQGYDNHLFWKVLVVLVGREKALKCPEKLKLISKDYHGEIFEGKACRTLLEKVDDLCDPSVYCTEIERISLQPFISAFKAMNKVVKSCFSSKKVNLKDLRRNIVELKKTFEATEVSETLKIHVILNHIEQCFELVGGDKGLGIWSEQAGESIHREFLEYWERYKINMISDSTYASRLKKAVIEFFYEHI